MNRNPFRIINLLLTVAFVFSIFNFTSCDNLEDVSLDAGLSSIAVTRLPDKIKYSRSDIELDVTGIEVTATFRSGSSKLIPLEELTFSGFRESEGYYTQTEVITITYTNSQGVTRSCSFNITYADLSSIAITQQPEKMIYSHNQPLDLSGLIITAAYQDNSTQPVFSKGILDLLSFPMYGPNNDERIISQEEMLEILHYCGRDGNGQLKSLKIPLSYKMDEKLNFILDDEGERILLSYIEFTGFDDTVSAKKNSQQEVIATYTEIDSYLPKSAQTKFAVSYEDVERVEILNRPIKTIYVKDTEPFKLDGLKLRAVYKNGSTETVFSDDIFKNLEITPEMRAKILAYTGGAGNDLVIPLEWKKDIYGHYEFDFSIPSDEPEKIPARELIIQWFNDPAHIVNGVNTLHLVYKDYMGSTVESYEQELQVSFSTLANIQIVKEPKTDYRRNDFFNFSGIIVRAIFENNSMEEIFNDNIFENLNTITPIERSAILSYRGRTSLGIAFPLVIPLEKDADGNILRKIEFEGFDSTKIVSGQEVKITYTDRTKSAQSRYNIRYTELSQIQMNTSPDKLKYRRFDTIKLDGLSVNAIFQDNSTEVIFDSEILEQLPEDVKTEINNYNGRNDSNEPVPLIIPLEKEDDKIVREIEFKGFDSTVIVSSQEISVKYTDRKGYTPITRETRFSITYSDLANIQLVHSPSKVRYKSNETIDLKDLIIQAIYSDNSAEEIFNNDILSAICKDPELKAQIDSFDGKNYSTLELPLKKDADGKVVRKISFNGFNTTVSTQVQEVTVTYNDSTGLIPIERQCKYGINFTGLVSMTVIQSPTKSNYIMKTDLGKENTSKLKPWDKLSDVRNWLFDAAGLVLRLTYTDNHTVDLNVKNSYLSDGAYNVEGDYQKITYKAVDSTGNEYNILITGFNPIVAFKNNVSHDTVSLSYTENSVTVYSQISVNYTFNQKYEFTEKPIKKENTNNYCFFGDYPQSQKDEAVEINTAQKLDKGLYVYRLGSDGNLYYGLQKNNETIYFKVEPIEWYYYNNSAWTKAMHTTKVLVSGIPYYSGKSDRKVTKDLNAVFDKTQQITATYNLKIYDGSFTFSTVKNFLNGNNQNGDNSYDGRGFLQTAFTPQAQTLMRARAYKELYASETHITWTTKKDNYKIEYNCSDWRNDVYYQDSASVMVWLPSGGDSSDHENYLVWDENNTSTDVKKIFRTLTPTSKPLDGIDYLNLFANDDVYFLDHINFMLICKNYTDFAKSTGYDINRGVLLCSDYMSNWKSPDSCSLAEIDIYQGNEVAYIRNYPVSNNRKGIAPMISLSKNAFDDFN